MSPTVYGFWPYKAYADNRRGSLVTGAWGGVNKSAVVENASFLFRSLDYNLPYEVLTARALSIEIYTASRGFLATAPLLFYCIQLFIVYSFSEVGLTWMPRSTPNKNLQEQ